MRTKEFIKNYQKEYRIKNKEKSKKYMKEYSKEYYLKNKNRLKPIRLDWENENKDKRKKIRQKYYINHVDELSIISNKFSRSDIGKYTRYKSSAKKRNLVFDLSKKYFFKLLSGTCKYCGSIEKIGIDRMDNNIGYTESNTCSCCTPCNMMKKTLTVNNFINSVKRIYEHNFK